MRIFYLDASAWVKYYTLETGSDWMNEFWRLQPSMASSEIAPLEVIAALTRRGRSNKTSAEILTRLGGEVDR